MADKQQEFTSRLKTFQPTSWELIPDLGLYMDQVITFIERQCKELFMDGDRIFTPSMVNNYVKIGLVERPVAKKYGREQLAQLLMICILKQSISAENMKSLVQPPAGRFHAGSLRKLLPYESRRCLRRSADLQPQPLMVCAVQGAAYQLLSNTLLCADKAEEKKQAPAQKEAKADAEKPSKEKIKSTQYHTKNHPHGQPADGFFCQASGCAAYMFGYCLRSSRYPRPTGKALRLPSEGHGPDALRNGFHVQHPAIRTNNRQGLALLRNRNASVTPAFAFPG